MKGKRNQLFLINILNFVSLLFLTRCTYHPEQAVFKTNVILIIVDDLNDWVGPLGGHPQVQTPHLDRLMQESILFSNAHCVAPVCGPSRASILTGRAPHRTGIYTNENHWNDAPLAREAILLPELFHQNGYKTYWIGKVHHDNPYSLPDADRLKQIWDDMHLRDKGYGPFPIDQSLGERVNHPSPRFFNYEIWKGDDFDLPDHQGLEYLIRQLESTQFQPFFLAYGIYRPHLPLVAPARFFDIYDTTTILLPETLADDLEDIPTLGKQIALTGANHQKVIGVGEWQNIVKAYLASISYMDYLVGRVIQALEASPYANNTILCLVSDHGLHLGEKQHWEKRTLWEESTRSLLMFKVPKLGREGGICKAPVSLLDIYPTLADLCELSYDSLWLDGESLKPWIKNPALPRQKPTLTTYGQGNYALRDRRWRYIRYRDGSEELYDHQSDPHEWKNIAQDTAYQAVISRLKIWLPD